jgi:LmbE family N-acetylglucosaminyl deacetylase
MTTAIAITAHHDDAVLWCGGTILRTARELGWKWTVVALCVPDKERQGYFKNYCGAVGVSSVAARLADYQEGPAFSRNTQEAYNQEIMNATQGKSFDWVFTHSRGQHGEYGFHANHAEVQEATKALAADGRFGAGLERLIYFSYSPIYRFGGLATVAKQQSAFYLQLTYEELAGKCDWCKRVPDARPNLENLAFPCPNPEAFAGDRVQLPPPFIRGSQSNS